MVLNPISTIAYTPSKHPIPSIVKNIIDDYIIDKLYNIN